MMDINEEDAKKRRKLGKGPRGRRKKGDKKDLILGMGPTKRVRRPKTEEKDKTRKVHPKRKKTKPTEEDDEP